MKLSFLNEKFAKQKQFSFLKKLKIFLFMFHHIWNWFKIILNIQ